MEEARQKGLKRSSWVSVGTEERTGDVKRVGIKDNKERIHQRGSSKV